MREGEAKRGAQAREAPEVDAERLCGGVLPARHGGVGSAACMRAAQRGHVCSTQMSGRSRRDMSVQIGGGSAKGESPHLFLTHDLTRAPPLLRGK